MAAAATATATHPSFTSSKDFRSIDIPSAPETTEKTHQSRTIKRDINTTLNYYKENEDGSPPAPTYIDRPETYVRPFSTHNVVVKDIRGEEDKYSLDTTGFQIYGRSATEKEFEDDDQIKASYYPEVEQLLKDITGASKIFIFDHTIRKATATEDPSKIRRGPVQRVHIDQSYEASLSRVPHHLPDEADELLKGRVQIINVWRPIKKVLRDPLAVADANSVPDEDLIGIQLIYPNRKGETYSVKQRDTHKWHYKSGLDTDEVILIKCFDSKTDGRARRVPHSAFVDPEAGDDVPTRESIEVRALVFHPDDRD